MIFALVITTVLAIVAMELKRTRSFLIDWLSIINLSMFAHYGLPAIFESLGFSLGNPWSMFTFWPRHSMVESISMATVLACGAWLLVNLAWMAMSRLTMYSMPAPRNVHVSAGMTILVISGLLGLALLGVVSRADQLGSFVTALVSGGQIRSGLLVNTSEYAFLTKFGDGARAAALIAFTWLLMSKRNYRVIPLLFLIASAVLLLLVAALDASRRYLLITGVLAIICLANFRGRLPWKFTSACAVIGLAILMFGDAISLRAAGFKRDIFSGQSISQLTGSVVTDIGLPLYETAIVVERSRAEPRVIDDIPAAAIELLPQRVLGIEAKPTLVNETTELILQRKQSSVDSIIPPSLVGWLWLSGGIAGVIAGAILFGAFAYLAELIILAYIPTGPIGLWAYAMLGFSLGFFVRSGYIPFIAQNTFDTVLFPICILALLQLWPTGTRQPTAIAPPNSAT